jgi:hypothetical protein
MTPNLNNIEDSNVESKNNRKQANSTKNTQDPGIQS